MGGGSTTTPQTHHKQKKVVGVPTLNRTKHPHHQKRRPGNTNPQTGQHSPVHSLKETVGSALLSHNPPVAVPSAQKGLTSRFGKDTGCNPLAKTTNTTKQATPQKKEVITHQSVKQYIHMYQPNPQTQEGSVKAVLAVNRTVDANTPKTNNLLLVIGQLVLVSWSPYNVYTPSLSTR